MCSDNRARRPWADHYQPPLGKTNLFDFYPKLVVTPKQRDLVVRLVNALGNRQFDATRCERSDHTEWMKERNSKLVAAGGDPEMEQQWRSVGAQPPILRWIAEGGYRIKVEPSGMGVFSKSGDMLK